MLEEDDDFPVYGGDGGMHLQKYEGSPLYFWDSIWKEWTTCPNPDYLFVAKNKIYLRIMVKRAREKYGKSIGRKYQFIILDLDKFEKISLPHLYTLREK